MSKIVKMPLRKIYQIKISLVDFGPKIWRRFLVPGDYKLSKLHKIIQIVMGWSESHLHEFVINHVAFGEPLPEDDSGRMLDHKKVTLEEMIQKSNQSFAYNYDFGDNWQHTLLVEKISPPEEGVRYPLCIAGERACPPEDCGGIPGYEDLLEALKNPKAKDHKELLEWIGDFDPEAFDVEEVNKKLKRIQ